MDGNRIQEQFANQGLILVSQVSLQMSDQQRMQDHA